mgnify:CR=1 FL=1
MERLTERIQRLSKEDLIVFRDDKAKLNCLLPDEMTEDNIRIMLKKLAAYEDTEEQGLLLRLPCKVGTQIYAIIYNFEQEKYMITETKIIEVTENCNGWFFKLLKNIPAFKLADFGVRVFLNRTEAEAKLAEMEGAE